MFNHGVFSAFHRIAEEKGLLFFSLSHDSVEHLKGKGFAFFHRNQTMNIFPGTNVGPVTKEHCLFVVYSHATMDTTNVLCAHFG